MKVGKHEFEQLVWIVVLIAAFSAIGFLLYKRLDIPIRDEYNGIIRDKWAAYSHLDQGSFVNYRLLVESESGERFKVVVDFETFRRAEIGMRIKRSKSGIELGNSQSRPLSFGVIEYQACGFLSVISCEFVDRRFCSERDDPRNNTNGMNWWYPIFDTASKAGGFGKSLLSRVAVQGFVNLSFDTASLAVWYVNFNLVW